MFMFKRRNSEASRVKYRPGTGQVYEDECNRLIKVVEHLTEQRKESVEIIRLVNKGLNDLISGLQKKHPKNDSVTPIPDELLHTVSTQLLNSIQAQNSVQAQLDGELLDDDDGYVDSNEANEGNSDNKRFDDDGLKTELVILQSQINRLRTEQDKITTKFESKQQKNSNGIGESSNHVHNKRKSIGLDSFNLSKESLPDSDYYNGINTGKNDDVLKKQEKEIDKLRKKIKIYEDQIKDYTSSVNGMTNESHVNGSANGVKDEIKKLQRSFHTFTSVSDDEIEINQDTSNELLESYQLGSFQNNIKSSRMRLAAALEAKITNLLNEQVEGYFATAVKDTYLEEDYDDNNLEYDIFTTTEKLSELLDRFADSRANGDESLRKTCTKLRSLIYSSLSTSSFSTFENGTHPFITSLTSQLLKFMDGYRTLPSAESSQVKEDAKQIILEFISLIYFKLKSLDPQPKLFYYDQGTSVDELNMKGVWDKTDVSNQVVEICYFPAVIVNQKNNSTISKAQVLARSR